MRSEYSPIRANAWDVLSYAVHYGYVCQLSQKDDILQSWYIREYGSSLFMRKGNQCCILTATNMLAQMLLSGIVSASIMTPLTDEVKGDGLRCPFASTLD